MGFLSFYTKQVFKIGIKFFWGRQLRWFDELIDTDFNLSVCQTKTFSKYNNMYLDTIFQTIYREDNFELT